MNHHFYDGNAEQHNFLGNTHTLPFDADMLWCKADMVLGDALSKCRGTGICKISVHSPKRLPRDCGCDAVPVFLAKINNRCLLLIIDKRQLDFVQQCRHFLQGYLALNKVLPLPAPLARSMQWTGRVSVAPRQYPLFQQGYYYHCYLDVRCTQDGYDTPK